MRASDSGAKRWTSRYSAIVKHVLDVLTDHARLMLPNFTALFTLEAHFAPTGFACALVQKMLRETIGLLPLLAR